MAIPDPPKAGSPFCALWTGGWNPKTPKINNFFIPEITLRRGYDYCLPFEALDRGPKPPLLLAPMGTGPSMPMWVCGFGGWCFFGVAGEEDKACRAGASKIPGRRPPL